MNPVHSWDRVFDVALIVMTYLPEKQVRACCVVSRSLCRAADSDDLWEELMEREKFVDSAEPSKKTSSPTEATGKVRQRRTQQGRSRPQYSERIRSLIAEIKPVEALIAGHPPRLAKFQYKHFWAMPRTKFFDHLRAVRQGTVGDISPDASLGSWWGYISPSRITDALDRHRQLAADAATKFPGEFDGVFRRLEGDVYLRAREMLLRTTFMRQVSYVAFTALFYLTGSLNIATSLIAAPPRRWDLRLLVLTAALGLLHRIATRRTTLAAFSADIGFATNSVTRHMNAQQWLRSAALAAAYASVTVASSMWTTLFGYPSVCNRLFALEYLFDRVFHEEGWGWKAMAPVTIIGVIFLNFRRPLALALVVPFVIFVPQLRSHPSLLMRGAFAWALWSVLEYVRRSPFFAIFVPSNSTVALAVGVPTQMRVALEETIGSTVMAHLAHEEAVPSAHLAATIGNLASSLLFRSLNMRVAFVDIVGRLARFATILFSLQAGLLPAFAVNATLAFFLD